MPLLYIDHITFGDLQEVQSDADVPRPEARTYEVTERVLALFNNWRYDREPESFTAGLIADAMDEECEKDVVWEALVGWMRGVFAGRIAWEGAPGQHSWKSCWPESLPVPDDLNGWKSSADERIRI